MGCTASHRRHRLCYGCHDQLVMVAAMNLNPAFPWAPAADRDSRCPECRAPGTIPSDRTAPLRGWMKDCELTTKAVWVKLDEGISELRECLAAPPRVDYIPSCLRPKRKRKFDKAEPGARLVKSRRHGWVYLI